MNTQTVQSAYLYPTPAGAYYTTLSLEAEPSRNFMRKLLTHPQTPQANPSELAQWMELSQDEVEQQLARLQDLGYLQLLPEPKAAPDGQLEELLPQLLPALSDMEHVLLSETHGLHLGSVGFDANTVEHLAALGAELAIVQKRYAAVLHDDLNKRMGSWALVNAAGNSEIGFWPIYFARQSFVVAIEGLPRFNQPEYTQLVWLLARRYGETV